MKHYATGYAFSSKQLFIGLNKNRLKLTNKECLEKYKCTLTDLINRIFKYSFKLVINDCIDNNVTFNLPTNKKKSWICMKKFSDEEFKKVRKNGKFRDVDFLESNFTGYQLALNQDYKGQTKQTLLYLNKKLKDKITEYTNAGKQYC